MPHVIQYAGKEFYHAALDKWIFAGHLLEQMPYPAARDGQMQARSVCYPALVLELSAGEYQELA